MSHGATGTLTTMLAGALLAGLPLVASAQSRAATTQPKSGPAASRPQTNAAQSSPQFHLDQARKALNSINPGSLTGDVRTQFAELRQHFAQLEVAWRVRVASDAHSGAAPSSHAGGHTAATGGMTSGTPAGTAAGTSGTPEQVGATGTPASRQTPARTGTMAATGGNDGVMTHFNALSRVLDRISPAPAAGASADANVDAATRHELVEFRKHLTEFNTTALVQRSSREDADATASEALNASDAAVARLTAQLDVLLDAGRPANGTVGTSGALATPGMLCVDRAKLEQLRIDLQGLRSRPR